MLREQDRVNSSNSQVKTIGMQVNESQCKQTCVNMCSLSQYMRVLCDDTYECCNHKHVLQIAGAMAQCRDPVDP
jgi:hypothetical protein